MISNLPTTGCRRMQDLPKEALEKVASYFQALSEPTRLSLLNLLRSGERNVGELAQLTGFTPANVSRHMALLTSHGLVMRESRGTSAYYRIADPSVYQLCDLVCGNWRRQFDRAPPNAHSSSTAAPSAPLCRRGPVRPRKRDA